MSKDTIYPTKSATESAIKNVLNDMRAMGQVAGDAIDYNTAMDIVYHLSNYKKMLERDMRTFEKEA